MMLVNSLLLSGILFSSCKQSEEIHIEPDNADTTTYCIAKDDAEIYRTFFKPPQGWFGDPFPYYDDGTFYIYYLQDWRGIQPYLHPFHLVKTTDLSSFNYEGEVLPVGSNSAQDAALLTGSVIKNKENGLYYMFYGGHKFNNDPATSLQAALIAVSQDKKHWTKDPTFYLSINGEGYDRNDFRDPFVYFDEEDGNYKMIATSRRNGKGVLALFSSSDLYDWSLEEPFYQDDSGAMLECADVFKEGEYWYLVYSNVQDRRVHYKYSSSRKGPWITPENPTLDGIAFYAGKTASDGTNRYIFAWCPTRIGDGDEDQWGGSLVTHHLVSQTDGTLAVRVPKGIEDKFNRKIEIHTIGQTGDIERDNDVFLLKEEAEVQFPRITSPRKITTNITASSSSDSFGFIFGACDSGEHYYVSFDLEKKRLFMDKVNDGVKEVQTENVLAFGDDLTFDVKIIIENSVCVMYVNDQVAFTNRIDKLSNNPWKIFSHGSTVSFKTLTIYEE